MRPVPIVLALLCALLCALLGGLFWSSLRSESSGSSPELPALAAPPAVDVERGEEHLAEVAREEVVRTGADAAEPAAAVDAEAVEPLVDPAIAAILEVRVVALETGRPLAGANVALYPKEGGDDARVQWLGGDPSQPPETDASGLARFHVVPDVAWQLWASLGETESAASGARAGESLEPFRAGERRAVTLRVRTIPDLKIVGRVIDGSSRAGVGGARVRFCKVMHSGDGQVRVDAVTELETDAGGWFEGEAASWRHLHGRVTAAGYGPAFVSLKHGHDRRESALVVELSRGATLRGRVLGAPDPGALAVRASAEGHALMARQEGVMMYAGEMVRKVAVEPDGRWELADLPPAVGLRLELLRATEVVRREPDRTTLAPGETRELEWRLGAGATVAGRVTIAGDGAPLVDHPVWLAPAREVGGVFRFGTPPTASRTTDEAGRFAFEDVAPGEWSVGPAPVRNEWEVPKPDEVVARGETVTVTAGDARVEIEVTAHRGLFIHGEVLEPDGTPLRKDGWIWGQCPENEMWLSIQAKRGRFAFGPLLPGTYALTASGGGFGPSLPVEARAGDEGVVLRLRSGGSIHGRLLDGQTGDPIPGEVFFVREGQSGDGGTLTMAQPDGRFEFTGVLPGTYRIQGSSGALVGEARGITVPAGTEVRDVEVRLHTGVALEVSYLGTATGGWYRVESEGVPLTFKAAQPGQVTKTRHLAGDYTVRLTLPGDEGGPNRELEREVTLVEGETAVVEFEDE